MRGASAILLFLPLFVFGQADSTQKKLSDYITLRGYVKDMQIAAFTDNVNDITNDNLIHNRLNFRLYPVKQVSMGFELRNRIFTGESVELIPNYAQLFDPDPGLIDMNWVVVDEPAVAAVSQVDRLWINWANDKWEVRAGRQRINWGINMFWNSNDVFNAFSLADFDYEERPGVDALRVQRHLKGGMNSIDVAVAPSEHDSLWVGAGMFRFNKWQYDWQVLGAWWNEDIALGMGWAGNLRTAGFKGEATWFHPQENWQDTSGVFSLSTSVDYVFKGGWFVMAGFLFNSSGVDTTFTFAQNLFIQPPSAKNLMPTKYSTIASVSYPITPLVSTSMTALYSPGVNTAFFMPSLGYSMANNWEVALFGQSFWMDTGDFRNIGNGVYVRLKGSF